MSIARYGTVHNGEVIITNYDGAALHAMADALIGFLDGHVTKTEYLQMSDVWWCFMGSAERKFIEPRPVVAVVDRLERV